MTTFAEYHAEMMQDPEYARTYNRIERVTDIAIKYLHGKRRQNKKRNRNR